MPATIVYSEVNDRSKLDGCMWEWNPMIDEEVTLKKLEVFLAFMRLHSLSRVA